MTIHKRKIINVVRRRNATITFFASGNNLYVEKKYNSTYQVAEEVKAYSELEKVADRIGDISTAEIVEVDEVANAICLRHVDGITLSDSFAKNGLKCTLSNWTEAILRLLVEAHRSGAEFDFDPSNFIISNDMSTLTVIDPVCRVDDLAHVALVIFIFGLFKYRIRYAYRLYDYKEFWEIWQSFIRRYSSGVGVGPEEIYLELSKYSKKVASWNCIYSKNERISVWLFRAIVLAFFWRLSGRWFSYMSSFSSR